MSEQTLSELIYDMEVCIYLPTSKFPYEEARRIRDRLREVIERMKARAWEDGLCVDPDWDEIADQLDKIVGKP